MFELYILAKNWKGAQFPTDNIKLNSPVLDGKTIKDLLQDSNSDSEKILFAGNRLMHQSIGETDLI